MMSKSCDSKRNKEPKAPSTLKLYGRFKKLEERELDRPIKQGGGINLADRIIYSICEAGYRTKRKNGKMVFDCKEAIRKDPLVWKFYKGNAEGLASRLRQVSESLEKHAEDYLKTTEGSRSLWRYQDLFGNVESFNALSDEIRSRIEKGEDFKNHSRRLQMRYHLYPHKKEKHPENWITIKEVWDWIAEDTKELSPGELEALRNCESLRPWSEDEKRLCKMAQAKNRAQEKIRRAAISA